MKRKNPGIFKWGLLKAAIILPLMFIFALPGQAELTYRDVSRSLNESMSGNIKNVITFALTILAIVAATLVFRLLRPGRAEDAGPKRRKIALRPLGQQQKRSWFRLKTSAEFKWAYARDDLKVNETQYKRDRLVDISGGGLCFRTAEKLNTGDNIRIFLDAGEDKPLSLNGQVLRVQEDAAGDSVVCKVSVQFRHLPGGQRDRIVSLIMKRQRETITQTKGQGNSPPSGPPGESRS